MRPSRRISSLSGKSLSVGASMSMSMQHGMLAVVSCMRTSETEQTGELTMAEIGEWEDAEPGVRRRILQAQGRLMLMEVQFAIGAKGYVHNHVHEQISYCIAGRFEYSLDGQIYVFDQRRVHLCAEQHASPCDGARAGYAARCVHTGTAGTCLDDAR